MQGSTILILIIVAFVAMVLGGWVSFTDSGDSASMTIHKEKVKADTESAVEQGKELLEQTQDQGEQLLDQSSQEQPKQKSSTEPERQETIDKS